MNLPKRLELLFLVVLAFPNDSRIGLESTNCSSTCECLPLRWARYDTISFVDSVFPAPDSPLITTHWLALFASMELWASSAMAKM